MRNISIAACVFAVGVLFAGFQPAQAQVEVEKVATVEFTDPVTGLQTTRVMRIQSDGTMIPAEKRVVTVLGAPVVVQSEFPQNPSDGQEFFLNGRKWEWDADDGRWELE